MTEAEPPKDERTPTEELESITVEELAGLAHKTLTRRITFELPDGTHMEKKVVFRRLTYGEIHSLKKIPEEDVRRYTSNVVYMASIMPKFEDVDEVAKVPHGFGSYYGQLILAESGKDPFLGRR